MVCILPGSRRHEVEHILPALLDAAALVRDQVPGTHFVLGLAEVVDRGQVGRILRACGWSAREPAEGQGGPRPGATPLAASSRGGREVVVITGRTYDCLGGERRAMRLWHGDAGITDPGAPIVYRARLGCVCSICL